MLTFLLMVLCAAQDSSIGHSVYRLDLQSLANEKIAGSGVADMVEGPGTSASMSSPRSLRLSFNASLLYVGVSLISSACHIHILFYTAAF